MQTKSKYLKVASYEAELEQVNKVVLLYSGGLDTSIMLKWIQDEYQCEVIALCVDLGQQLDDLEALKQKAIKLGASAVEVIDAKDEFANEVISLGIKANASYQRGYHLSTPMGRVILAKAAVEIAKKYNADTIAHGATGKGNDQVRIESYILTLYPEAQIIAPVREWDMSRDEQIDYAKRNGINVPASVDFPYSVDDNMWGMTWEGGEIEDSSLVANKARFLNEHPLPQTAKNAPETVSVRFEQGIPTQVNGKKYQLAELIKFLNQIGGKNGCGIIDMVEDRLVGVKSGGVYDMPAASIIIKAHKALEQIVSTRELNELKEILDVKWAYLCYGAKWFDPTMDAINAFNDQVNQQVTGDVIVELYKGNISVVAIDSLNKLDSASFNNGEGAKFNVNSSSGFIEIYSQQMVNYRN